MDYSGQPQVETASINPRCIDCPARLYAEENALLINDTKGTDSAEARAWQTFANNLMKVCVAGEPTVESRRQYFIAGDTVLVVKCASSTAGHHPSKITRRVISPAPGLGTGES